MDVLELRSDLHNLIDKISDSNVLQALKTLLANKITDGKDWWMNISEEEREEILEGIAEAEKGDLISHNEVMAKYQKWL